MPGDVVDEGGKLRVALGVVVDAASLEKIIQAFEELANLGFSPADAVLLCSQQAMDGQCSKGQAEGYGNGLVHWPRVIVRGSHGDEWPNAGRDDAPPAELLRIVQFDDWMEPVLASDLSRQLRDGACLLFVPVKNEILERNVCRALLRYAADRVQVHDLPSA